MANAIQMPDFAGAYSSGRQAFLANQEAENQNALRAAMQQHGPGAFKGDQNALAAIAQYDPQFAMQMQAGQQDMRLADRADQRSERTAQHSMSVDNQRLALARQEGQRAAAEHAARMSAAERQREAEETGRFAVAADRAWQQGPEAFAGFMQQFDAQIPEEFKGLSYEDAPYAVSLVTGMAEGFGAGSEPIKMGSSDRLVDPRSGQEIVGPSTDGGFRQASPEESAAYGAVAGQFGPDGRFYPVNPPSGMTVETGPDGEVRIVQGPGVSSSKPLNEGQSKNVIFATRAEGALQTLDPIAESLSGLRGAAAGQVPLGGYLQSPEYQMARQAGDEFLQAILRKDTGAAITPQEQMLYGRTYLPQPGDSPEVMEQKKQSRTRALDALRRGMTPAEMLALEKPMVGDGGDMADMPGETAPYPQPKTREEYDQYPSGTYFIAPDGSTRVKP